jgi:hypothetical protein
MWRYRELMPLFDGESPVTLGEGFTPLFHARALGATLGLDRLYIKDESLNPTNSFKARGQSAAITRARYLGATTISLPTAGNAGNAAAAYSSAAGLACEVFIPKDAKRPFIDECRLYGAHVTLVDGLITDAGRMAAEQGAAHGWKGRIVTNPNCSTAGLVVVLKPLADAFGIEKLFVVTLQAISGAGYPGVPAMDIVGNVVPFISGEEEKMEAEPQKLLGKWDGSRFIDAGLGLSAHCNRVHVIDGHLECVSLSLKKIASLAEVREALRNFTVSAELASLPSAVRNPVVVVEEADRPQPRRDVNAGNGMAAVVGRVRECPLLDVKLTLLSHNLVRGAAGAALLNAELLAARGFFRSRVAAAESRLDEPISREAR